VIFLPLFTFVASDDVGEVTRTMKVNAAEGLAFVQLRKFGSILLMDGV